MRNGYKAEEFLYSKHWKRIEPTNAEVMVKIGYHVHAKKEQWVEMNEIFNKALSTDPAAKIDNMTH